MRSHLCVSRRRHKFWLMSLQQEVCLRPSPTQPSQKKISRPLSNLAHFFFPLQDFSSHLRTSIPERHLVSHNLDHSFPAAYRTTHRRSINHPHGFCSELDSVYEHLLHLRIATETQRRQSLATHSLQHTILRRCARSQHTQHTLGLDSHTQEITELKEPRTTNIDQNARPPQESPPRERQDSFAQGPLAPRLQDRDPYHLSRPLATWQPQRLSCRQPVCL